MISFKFLVVYFVVVFAVIYVAREHVSTPSTPNIRLYDVRGEIILLLAFFNSPLLATVGGSVYDYHTYKNNFF